MNSKLTPQPQSAKKSAYALLKALENLAEEAYVAGEVELSYVIAASAGAFGNGIISDIGSVFTSIIGPAGRAGILKRLSDETARVNAGKN